MLEVTFEKFELNNSNSLRKLLTIKLQLFSKQFAVSKLSMQAVQFITHKRRHIVHRGLCRDERTTFRIQGFYICVIYLHLIIPSMSQRNIFTFMYFVLILSSQGQSDNKLTRWVQNEISKYSPRTDWHHSSMGDFRKTCQVKGLLNVIDLDYPMIGKRESVLS